MRAFALRITMQSVLLGSLLMVSCSGGTGGEGCATCATCTAGVCAQGSGGGGDSNGGGNAGSGGSATGGGSPSTCASGTPCGSGSYCDLGSGLCKPGCIDNSGCESDRACDVATHACVCKPGTHACGGACVSDADAMHCGSTCTVCSGPPANGVATCVAGACAFTCQPGFNTCGNRCVSESDATACGAACQVCPGGVAQGSAACNVGTCGIRCNPGRVYEPSTGTCNPVTATVLWSDPFPGAVATWDGPFDQLWAVPMATGFRQLALRTDATGGDSVIDTASGQENATAFGALPTQLSAAQAGSHTRYLTIIGGTVKHFYDVSSTSYAGCSWVHPQVQNPLKVLMGSERSTGIAWAAVQTAQGITFAQLQLMSGTCSPVTTHVAAPGATLWSIANGALYYSVGNTLTLHGGSLASTAWTLPGPVEELAPPLVRVGSKVYLLDTTPATFKRVADDVVAMGPAPFSAFSPVCLRYGDGLRCSYLDGSTRTLHPPSLVTTDVADFHSVAGWGGSRSLFYRVGSQIKSVRLK